MVRAQKGLRSPEMNPAANDVDGLGCCLLVPFLVVWLVVVRIWFGGASRDAMVQEWAKEAGYLLTQCEQRAFFRGPFCFPASRRHSVYRVTVLDADNRRSTGWV